jgi:predicted SnoaL-like aldol condensation-catalyzing enzyme
MTFDPRDTANRESLSVREVAERFIELFHHQDNVTDAFRCWVHPDYIQHNPNAQDGRDAAIAFLEPFYQRNPNHKMTVYRVLVDGDLIAVHLRGQDGPDDPGAAAVDILRVKDCKIVEHWDVTQKVPEKSANGHGMF